MASLIPIGIQPIPFSAGPGIKLNRVPVGLTTPIRNNIGPNSVRFDIDWKSAPYSASTLKPTVAVEIDLLGQAVQTPLDMIRSVYIDNSNSITPIYIVFPDTGFLIQCPPRSVAWQPVLTGQQKAIIFGVGFVSDLVPITPVHFTNIDVAGYVIPIVGSNLVRGQAVGGAALTTLAVTNPLVPVLGMTPALAPDRLMVAIIACRSTLGTPSISAPTIGGVAAQIELVANATASMTAMAIISALVPTGSVTNVQWTTAVGVVDYSAHEWALYNYTDRNPYWTGGVTNGASALRTISPFVTQDGFAVLGADAARNPPVDTVWVNALENGQFNTGQLEFSVATVDGGKDNYVPVTINQAERVLAAAWN